MLVGGKCCDEAETVLWALSCDKV